MPFISVIPGLGCTVSTSSTSGGSYTAIGQLQGIDGTNWEVGMFDSTGLASAAAEQVPTIFKAGEFGFTVLYDPANTSHVALATAMVAKTLLYFKLTFPSPLGPDAVAPGSPKTYIFAAYVNKYAASGFEVESGLIAAIGVAITGGVTIA